MVSDQEKTKIVDIARQYDAQKVLLFGSCADQSRDSHDIDLAVDGVSPEKFFDLYGQLLFSLSKPVDLVDLSFDSKFSRLIQREGTLLYDNHS